LAQQKNLAEWLEVAAAVCRCDKSAMFDIVGAGPLRDGLRTFVEERKLSDRIRFCEPVPYDQLAAYYRAANVFLLTSHYEGCPRVLVEASACGVPIVAVRISGVEDIVVHGKTGFLHTPGDVEGMASSILRLLREPDLAARMGSAGREYVREKFNPDRLTREWVGLLVSSIRRNSDALLLPKRRTVRRWRHVGFSSCTLLRSLQYEALHGLVCEGRSLDIGGGRNTSYHHLLAVRGTLESLNIDRRRAPTFVADLNNPLPIRSETYDNIISLNTFEHVWNDRFAISECMRVLKTGGRFHFMVPFLYHVHASPLDYHRHTAWWWIDLLKSLELKEEQFTIEPLVWDRLSSAYSFIGHGPLGRLLKIGITFLAVAKDVRWLGRERLPNRDFAHHTANLALGYYVCGTK
jgi:hypothetical protein